MKPIQVGDRFKVKATPWTRKSGVSTHGAWQAKGDDRAWPGEIGTIVRRDWTCDSGETNFGFWLEFDRGRARVCGGGPSDATITIRDPEDFLKVK